MNQTWETGLASDLLTAAAGAISQVLSDAGLDPSCGWQVIPAVTLLGQYHPSVNVTLPVIITNVCREARPSLMAVLRNAYPDDHPLVLLRPTDAGRSRCPLHALAQLPFETEAALLLPPLPPGSSFTDLQEIVAHLRAPDGCPWDREQTLASLRQDLQSEAVEVLEAIDLEATGIDNSEHIAEELGDVLMLATLLTQIAIDEGRFRMADVLRHIVEKLIRRHPHVFGDVEVDGNAAIVANWDAIKAEEKAGKGIVAGPLDGVPAHLPALEKARTVQSKASKAGLLDRAELARSWPALAALADGADGKGPGGAGAAFGKLLWVVVAMAHERGVNAEDALRSHVVAYRTANGT